MNKLDFSVSLRRKGLDSTAIRKRMVESGFEESEIQYYLKRSDEIFLNQIIKKNSSNSPNKFWNSLKYIGLAISLLLLLAVLLGYVQIGFLWLFALWGLVGISSTKRK